MLAATPRSGVPDADADTVTNTTPDCHSHPNPDAYANPYLATVSETADLAVPTPALGGSPGIARGLRGAAIPHPTERAPSD